MTLVVIIVCLGITTGAIKHHDIPFVRLPRRLALSVYSGRWGNGTALVFLILLLDHITYISNLNNS